MTLSISLTHRHSRKHSRTQLKSVIKHWPSWKWSDKGWKSNKMPDVTLYKVLEIVKNPDIVTTRGSLFIWSCIKHKILIRNRSSITFTKTNLKYTIFLLKNYETMIRPWYWNFQGSTDQRLVTNRQDPTSRKIRNIKHLINLMMHLTN